MKQIADAAGRDSNVIVVSDHGFAPFHTSVNLTNILRNAGIDTSKVGIRTSGPAADIYINLQNRELGGTVDLATYRTLVAQITDAVKNAVDPMPASTTHSRTSASSPSSRPGRCNATPEPDNASARPSARTMATCSR
ncbi:alkaline phosphatase family protein [Bradyrhizobium elkanii]|nr:alkaline phosphatase family protein [Bradyrhizobium elkanii]